MHLEYTPMQEFLWNPRQWQASRKVQRMSWSERGLYRELMDECYLHGAIPRDVGALANMLGESIEVISEMWPKVSRCFEPDPEDPSLLVSPFIEAVRDRQNYTRKSNSVSGKAGARRRWQKDGAGHPVDSDCYPPDGNCMAEASRPMANDGEEGGREGVITSDASSLRSEASSVTELPVSAKPPRARNGKDVPFSLEIPEPILDASNAILDVCPKVQSDGKKIRRDPGLLAQRLEGIVAQALPGVDLGLLVDAWKAYLASSPQSVKAPQYYFGSEGEQGSNGAHWIPWARLMFKKRKDAAATVVPLQTATA